MRLFSIILALVLSPILLAGEPNPTQKSESVTVAPGDWPWWRGPTQDGVANPDQKPPTTWSGRDNVLWKVLVPGRGHGSPTVVGERVFLATADEKKQIQSVLCYDRSTGKLRWRTDLHEGGFSKKGNKRASRASGTPACDGRRVFISFETHGAVYTTALDLDGKKLWQTKITDYVVHQGYGSSPMLYKSLVLVTADNKGGGAVAGLDRASGKIVWRILRPKKPNYVSPILVEIDGKTRMVLAGVDVVTCVDPMTGKKLWEKPGATTECVTSLLSDGRVVVTSGGYPRNHVEAMAVDGSGKIVWSKKTRVYVPSMVLCDGYLFGVSDAGSAYCWDMATGEEKWRQRIGGTFNASLVRVGKTIYATNQAGKTVVFSAYPKAFERIAVNNVGDEVFPSPAICGSRIFMRVAETEGEARQEYLYCIGKKE